MGILGDAKTKLQRELLHIEKRDDLTDDQKVSRVRQVTCAVCAGVAVQPLPFGDIFLLTPIQGLMAYKIAAIRGVNISEQGAGQILKEILGVVGLGLAAQQLAIGAYKTVLPFWGAVTTIPLVYSLTYAIGSLMDVYFTKKAAGEPMDDAMMKRVWKEARKESKNEAKRAANSKGKDQAQDVEITE